MTGPFAGRVLVTLGDPGGIGPEVALKALHQRWLARGWPHGGIVTIGHRPAFAAVAHDMPLAFTHQAVFLSPHEALALLTTRTTATDMPWIVVDPADTQDGAKEPRIVAGQPSAESGMAAFAALEFAWAVLQRRLMQTSELMDVGALVTAPISKQALRHANVPFVDHTTWLGARTNRSAIMSFIGGGLRVILATVHLGLAKVPGALSVEGLARLIVTGSTCLAALERLHLPARVAVCGLNPHAGEQGLFGHEDNDIVRPAINQAQATAPMLSISGPWPADTVFWRARQGEFDVVIAMYHDQGLVAVKTVDFHQAVNATLNLPLIRTSPDHGTAYDIAGRGCANPQSMSAALNLALKWLGEA